MVSRTGAVREEVHSTGAEGAGITSGGRVMKAQEQPLAK